MDMLTATIVAIPLLIAGIIGAIILFSILPWLLVIPLLCVWYVGLALWVTRHRDTHDAS